MHTRKNMQILNHLKTLTTLFVGMRTISIKNNYNFLKNNLILLVISSIKHINQPLHVQNFSSLIQ